MDLDQLNMIAGGSTKPTKTWSRKVIYKPISALKLNQQYRIVNIRKGKTVYGEKVIVDMIDPEESENIFCYFPHQS